MAIYYTQQAHTAPEIISLQKAKDHLKVDFDTDDDLIMDYIKAAVNEAQNYSEIALEEQKYKVLFDEWTNYHEIQRTPVQSVTSIKYTDTAGDVQTLPTTAYTVLQLDKYASELQYTDFDTLPTIKENTRIEMDMVVGYQSGKVPADVRSAILLIVGNLYENREDKVHNLPNRVQSILRAHRLY